VTTPDSEALVAAFLTYAERDRGWSPNTLRSYRSVLQSLAGVATWTTEDADRWWDTTRELAPTTRENHLAVLRSFYRWATKWDHRPDDPTRRLITPKIHRRQPRPIAREELRRVLELCDERERPDLRRATVLGAYAGLRVGEAAALDWSAVNTEHRRIIVDGKGSKERVVGYSPVLMDELLPDTGGNVVKAGEAPLTADTLQRAMTRLFNAAGCPPEVTFHALRKRWATLAIPRAGVHAVAKAAGWASIETASVYAAVSDESLDLIAAAVVE
jgi:integrase/recombinase XerD